MFIGWISSKTVWNWLQHLDNTDDSVLKTIINLWLLFPGCSSENTNHQAILSLGMNQRSPLSLGQWRRAVHLTPVSLVQTKCLPSGDTLFLPGSLITGRITHHAHISTEKGSVCTDTKTYRKGENRQSCWLTFQTLCKYSCCASLSCPLSLSHQPKQLLWDTCTCENLWYD